jgi:hypothetical protein
MRARIWKGMNGRGNEFHHRQRSKRPKKSPKAAVILKDLVGLMLYSEPLKRCLRCNSLFPLDLMVSMMLARTVRGGWVEAMYRVLASSFGRLDTSAMRSRRLVKTVSACGVEEIVVVGSQGS